MSTLDSSIVLIALPTISRQLPETTSFDLLWILVGYQLVVAAVIVNLGRLSDIFGRVRLYNMGFAIFTVSSGLCSLSQTGIELLGFRVVQGFGSALLIANSTALITDAYPMKERGRAIGSTMAAVTAGSVSGLVLGGFLTSTLGWRSIFWINVPIGGFATLWSHYRLRELSTRSSRRGLDIMGNVTFAAGLVLVLAGLTLVASTDLNKILLLSVTGIGAVLLVLFAQFETKAKDPMLDLGLFRNRAFGGAATAQILCSLAWGSITLVMVFFLQGPTMKLSALESGVFLVPYFVTALLAPLSGHLTDRYGPRLIASIGISIASAGTLLLSQTPATVDLFRFALAEIPLGVGQTFFYAPNRTAMMNSVSPEVRGVASAVGTTMANVGTTMSRIMAYLIMSTVISVISIQALFTGGAGAAVIPPASFIESIKLVYYVSLAIQVFAILPSVMRPKRFAIEEAEASVM